MQTKMRHKSSFKAGMYLLETLTSGMYNEPLSIYREYIQNAVDSIDFVRRKKRKTKLKINIDLYPFERRIIISDNGFGLPSEIAEKTLSSIGSSDKANTDFRGFRGIGRLGGLAFCNRATFQAKALSEEIESIQEWDCRKLMQYLSNSSGSKMTLRQLFKKTTNFYQQNSKSKSRSYFKVNLEGVSSFRNHVFDIKKVRDYLSQVAPLPFDSNIFSHRKIIDNYLQQKLSHYSNYEIILNGDKLFKPYQDEVKTTKRDDRIVNIKFFDILVKDTPVAYGWYGERRDLLGAITKGDMSSGIRVRVGNILLGDAHLLDGCFREARFNGYLIGEIHVDHPDLIPNSRRDDFIDNEMKTRFYDAIEQEIGLPLSKEIRYRSRSNSKLDNLSKRPNTIDSGNKPKEISHKFHYSEIIKEEKHEATDIFKDVNQTCKGCPKLSVILSLISEKSIL